MEKTVHILSLQVGVFLQSGHSHPTAARSSALVMPASVTALDMIKLFVPICEPYVNGIQRYVLFLYLTSIA